MCGSWSAHERGWSDMVCNNAWSEVEENVSVLMRVYSAYYANTG